MDRRGLGRGLDALIPDSSGEKSGVFEIAIDAISANPWQPRRKMHDESIEDLARSVTEHGVIQPVVVRSIGQGKYQLVAGERRLRASRAAGLTSIPAIVRDLKDQESLELALVENLQREDISPLDAAFAYKQLMDEFNLTQDEVARKVGKSRSAVANTLRLLKLPTGLQQRLESGELTEGHARAILSISSEQGQRVVADEIIRRKCSVREAERLARSWRTLLGHGDISRATSTAEPEVDVEAVAEELRKIFSTRVTVTMAKGRGFVSIEFYSEDDLNRILALLGAIPGQPSPAPYERG